MAHTRSYVSRIMFGSTASRCHVLNSAPSVSLNWRLRGAEDEKSET